MTYVKICGLTNIADARVAAEAGADLLGFIFYPPSPRYIPPEQAKEIIGQVRAKSKAKMVGVFVNESVERVRAVVELCGLDLVQLHGDEGPETIQAFAPLSYKAIRVQTAADARVLTSQYCEVLHGRVPAFVVDAFSPKLYGGTGRRADWEIAREMASAFPILLAGGLGPDNVVEAIAAVRPWGVDVSSGVERAPGLKDHTQVRALMARAKE